MVELWKESPRGLVKEGDAVELRCQGDGNPPPSFSFTREQVRIGGILSPREGRRGWTVGGSEAGVRRE